MTSTPAARDRVLGTYRELPHGDTAGPSLADAVRDHPQPDEQRLVAYLRAGSVIAVAGVGVHDRLSPGREFIAGLDFRTDGSWYWYSDLAHYVERYHVPLDPRFAAHARGRGWVQPRLSDEELMRADAVLAADAGPGDG
ncbi:hypothetical protein [Streptomyces sp. NPDC089919]|uniref:hypothetical protein n=1 Tax=Streptomyces sp. NPDC089919 TaxID=3155188 RepID=UPI00342131A9